MLPTNVTPITNWPDRDKAFHNITKQVYQAVSELQKRRTLDKASKLALQKSTVAHVEEQNSISLLIAKPDAIKVLLRYEGSSAHSMTLSPDGLILVGGGGYGEIPLWDVQTTKLLRTLTGDTGNTVYRKIALSVDGSILASVWGQIIKLWDARTGQPIRTIDCTGGIGDIALSADGRTLIRGNMDRTIKFWDVQTGRIFRTLTGHKEAVLSVKLSQDGRTLASYSGRIPASYGGQLLDIDLYNKDTTVKLWDVQKGKCLRTLTDHTSEIQRIELSADGRTLATVHYDFYRIVSEWNVKIWDVRKGKLLRTTDYFDVEPKIALSADGQLLAYSVSKGILLWDILAGYSIRTLTDNTSDLEPIVLSANGRILACNYSRAIVWGLGE